MSKPRSVAVGFLFNPIAGMGGKVGLHGTDHDNFTTALARGASPVARERALRAFKPLVAFRKVLASSLPMVKWAVIYLINLASNTRNRAQ